MLLLLLILQFLSSNGYADYDIVAATVVVVIHDLIVADDAVVDVCYYCLFADEPVVGWFGNWLQFCFCCCCC